MSIPPRPRAIPFLGWLLLSTLPAAVGIPAAEAPRNVILMIADGAGYNAWAATAMYEGSRGKEFFDASGWVHVPVSTYALRTTREAPVSADLGATQLPALVYDPLRAWDPTPVEGESRGYPYHFAGYRFLRSAPDSANTATALVTGVKTYPGSINYSGTNEPIERTLPWLAHEAGMRVGTVTSVQITHATPAAAGGAHAESRSDHCTLGLEMLTSPVLDVIAGCCDPDYDNNGKRVDDPSRKDYRDLGSGAIWDAVTGRATPRPGQPVCDDADVETMNTTKGESVDDAPAEPASDGRFTAGQIEALERWSLKQSKQEVRALATGPSPDKLLIVPRVGRIGYWTGWSDDEERPWPRTVGGTLQQQRGSRARPEYTAPGDDPPLAMVPSLADLTRAALNALDDDPDGMFLHVEGGAVDWAMHANQLGRTIEEMMDFKRAVEAVIEWVEAGDGWEHTLVVITADHDHLLWGPQSDRIAFQPLQDRGSGKLPGYRWLSNGHSNQLVPLYARGVGAQRLLDRAVAEDPFRGSYVDQTDVFRVMESFLTGSTD